MNRLKWQWEENPMISVLCWLSAGVWAGTVWPTEILVSGICIAGLLPGGLHFFRHLDVRMSAWIRTFICWGCCFAAGAGLSVFRSNSGELPAHSAFFGVITSYEEPSENGSRRCLARILRVRKKDGSWEEVNGSAVLWFKGQASPEFRSGAGIVASIPLRGIPAPALPGEFNAKKWYRSQGIFWQAFFGDSSYRLIPRQPEFSLRNMAVSCRLHLENIFLKNLPSGQDAAMLSALLLGIRKKMDPELKEAYSAAGLTHILAVSGMHVALIFGFFSFLLKGIKNLPAGRFLFSISITCLLWFYALVTGLSPSVLRAVCLFTVMQFSDVLRKPSLPINNLCFTSILLILADQEILFDLGYQLSFSAVYGIISFQPYFIPTISGKNRLIHFVLENTSVTLAASLATLPLILFHFHRFPVYFLLSNLLAVPLSNLLIYAGIALLALSPLSMLAKACGWMLHCAIELLNGFVQMVNNLPFSSLNHLYITSFEMISILVLILAFQIWVSNKQLKFLNSFLLLSFLFSLLQLIVASRFAREDHGLFAVHYEKNWFLLRKGIDQGIIYPVSGGSTVPDFLQKGMKLQELRVTQPVFHPIFPSSASKKATEICILGNYKLLILNGYLKNLSNQKPIPMDFILVGNVGEKSLQKALEYFSPKAIWTNWPAWRVRNFRKKMKCVTPIYEFRSQKIRQIESATENLPPKLDPENETAKIH